MESLCYSPLFPKRPFMKKLFFSSLFAYLTFSHSAFASDYVINVTSEAKTMSTTLNDSNTEAILHFGKKISSSSGDIYNGTSVRLKLVHENNKNYLIAISSVNDVQLKTITYDDNPNNEPEQKTQLDEALKFVNEHGSRLQKAQMQVAYNEATEPMLNSLHLPSIMNQMVTRKFDLSVHKEGSLTLTTPTENHPITMSFSSN